MHSNREKSEQFLETECFFNFFLGVSQEQLEFKLEKMIGIYKPEGKVRKICGKKYHCIPISVFHNSQCLKRFVL